MEKHVCLPEGQQRPLIYNSSLKKKSVYLEKIKNFFEIYMKRVANNRKITVLAP